MSGDYRARAFDRFYRGSARGETEGAGLGLSIAKRVLERMDGTIALAGECVKGTTVTLNLPSFASDRRTAAGTEAASVATLREEGIIAS